MNARAATTESLHLLLITPAESLSAAMRKYERARDHAAKVTVVGWRLIAAELRWHGAGSRAATDRAESCDARALTASAS